MVFNHKKKNEFTGVTCLMVLKVGQKVLYCKSTWSAKVDLTTVQLNYS